MHTEAEAKTKWCPFAISYKQVAKQTAKATDDTFIVGVPAFNRKPVGNAESIAQSLPISCACVASACMAWTWEREGEDTPENQRGYCGLARQIIL